MHFCRPIDAKQAFSLCRATSCRQGFPTRLVTWHVFLALSVLLAPPMRAATDPEALLKEADRLAELGNLNRARDLYAEAETLFGQNGDRAKMFHAKFGRLRRDVEKGPYDSYLQLIADSLVDPVVAADPLLQIRGLSVQGLIHMNLDGKAARKDWTTIAELAQKIGDDKWANRARGQLGLVAGSEGDYATALTSLATAIQKARALGDLTAEIYFRTFLGNGLVANNRPEQALPMFDDAIALGTKSVDSGYPIMPVIGKVRGLRAMKKRDEALRLIEESLRYSREHQILGAQAELLVQAGLIAFDAKEFSVAEAAYLEAANVARAASLPRMLAAALGNLVDVYSAKGDAKAALRMADEAIATVRQPGEIYDLPSYLARKAELEAKFGRLNEARLIYDEARQLIEGMLVNMPSSPARSSLIAVMSRVYMGQFKLAASRPGGVARAFEIIETARGRSVADSLRFGAHRPGDAPSAAELKIIGVQRRIRSSRTPAEMRRLLFELERVELELAGFESPRNRKSFQDMALLGSKPVPLNFLERELAPDEAILEYVLDEPSSYCIEIRRTGSSIHSLEGKRTIEAAVDAVVGAIKRKEAFQEKARQLHRLLLSCSSSAATRRLIVVPDGKLHTMPFAALIDSDGRYLIESMTIGYAPSGTVLSVVRGNGKTDGLLKPLFALASSPDVARKSKDVSTTRGFFEEVGSKLGPLPFAKEEVATIGNAAGPGSVLLVDQQASEAELKRQALDRFKIVHIVAHAIVSEKDPERSGLLLQPGSAGEDGLWQPREIRRQRLQADLVTLSACQTAVGKLEGQEGVINLARTFLAAGAGSVAASLWMVDDRSTATLMGKFYTQLSKGKNVSDALRDAQLEMIQDFGKEFPPYYWAGFSVIGDGTQRTPLGPSAAIKSRTR
jgi:CHAT domain-containing protein/tetratricopeptide (TPR) repeat protein